MKNLKLLHVIAGMDPASGGVCQAVKTIINALAPAGIINEVVSLDAINSPYLKATTFCIHPMGIGLGPWKINSNLKEWLPLNLPRFDMVIVHGLWLYTGFAVRMAIQFLQRNRQRVPKVFVMPHGMLDPYFQLADKRKFKAIRNLVFWKLIENKLISFADAILFTCEKELQLASHTFKPYQPKLKLVVGLAVESPPVFTNKMKQAFYLEAGLKNDDPYLLFLGRIEEKKGISYLLQAYINLIKLGNKLPALVIAGPGFNTLYGRALKEIGGSYPSIYFVDMLNGDAKWGAFYCCEAFVLTSKQENFGIAIIEAMACGKPVLISDQVNIYAEIVQSGAGLSSSVAIKDIEIMLLQWMQLSNHKKIAMAKAAANCFNTLFSVQIFSKRMTDLLLTI